MSCLVITDGYFLQTSRYIHLNPVKARIVDRPEEYRCSSYITIMDMWNDGIVYPDKTLSYFAEGAAVRVGDRPVALTTWGQVDILDFCITAFML